MTNSANFSMGPTRGINRSTPLPRPTHNPNVVKTDSGHMIILSKPIERGLSIEDQLKMDNQKILGTGGTAIIQIGTNMKNRDPVAAKLFKGKITDEKIKREIFFMERCAGHTNILKNYGIAAIRNDRYIIVEYAGGGSLRNLISKLSDPKVHKKLNKAGYKATDYVRYLLRGIFSGYQYMHSKGITHRDIKTENILLSETGLPKITDFGFSQITAQKDLMDQLEGTSTTFPPELIIKNKNTISDHFAIDPANFRAEWQGLEHIPSSEKQDSWQLGLMLFDLATNGRLPFEIESAQASVTEAEQVQQIIQYDFSNLYPIEYIVGSNMYINPTKPFPTIFQNNLRGLAESMSLDTLIKGLLTVNPEKRFSINDARQSKFITENRAINDAEAAQIFNIIQNT